MNAILGAFETIGRRASFHLAGNNGGHSTGTHGVNVCKAMFQTHRYLQAEMLEIGKTHFIFADEMKGWA
jgi:hypothetical protein